MASIRRAAERSLAAASDSEAMLTRRQEITSVTNPAKRAGLMAVHALAVRKPACVALLLGVPHNPDLVQIAETTQSKVYWQQRAGEVIKVIKEPSQGLTAAERRRQADTLREEHSAMFQYLGQFMLPQEIAVRRHPFRRDRQAIQIHQPYEEITDPRLFVQDTTILLTDNLDSMRGNYPRAAAQLCGFVRASRALYEAEALLADTNGASNVVVNSGGGLLLVDGQPVTTRHPEVQEIILGQHDNLEAALTAAA